MNNREEKKPFISKESESLILNDGLGQHLRNKLSPYSTLISLCAKVFKNASLEERTDIEEFLKKYVDENYFHHNLEDMVGISFYEDFAGNIYSEVGELLLPNPNKILEREELAVYSKLSRWHTRVVDHILEFVNGLNLDIVHSETIMIRKGYPETNVFFKPIDEDREDLFEIKLTEYGDIKFKHCHPSLHGHIMREANDIKDFESKAAEWFVFV